MFRGKTNMFRGIATLPRLNTCLLSSAGSRLENETLLHETSKLFHGSAVFRRRNTAVLRGNRRLLRGNLKQPPPDCTPEISHATRRRGGGEN